ncbi:MAG: acyltransferase family protein [Clostridia bacterium]|nr:acyltransferase family protein [Clostridia bacterium]
MHKLKATNSTTRNCEIDLFKFVFSIIIVLYHARLFGDSDLGDIIVFGKGALAVEFFFLISGFYFIPGINNFVEKNSLQDNSVSVFTEGVRYVFSRIKSIAIIGIFSLSFSLVSYTYTYIMENVFFNPIIYIFHISRCIWTVLFLDAGLPIQADINRATWYLSAMFIVMLIMYPLARKKRDFFVKYFSPLTIIFVLGVIIEKGRLTYTHSTNVLHITSGLSRAIVGILLGCIIYEISQALTKIKFPFWTKLFFTIIAYGGIFFCLIVMNYNTKAMLPISYDPLVDFSVIPVLAIVVLILASDLSLIKYVLPKKICGFLGKFSVIIFLMHLPCRGIIFYLMEDCTYIEKTKAMLILSLAVSLITMLIVFIINKISAKILDIKSQKNAN